MQVLTDYPGQGTAPVGVLDAFWESKGGIRASNFQRFCGPIVPLARLPKRVFTTDEDLSAELEVANFSAAPLTNVAPYCRLVTEGGRVVASGIFRRLDVPVDNGISLGQVNFNLGSLPAPARYRLVVGFNGTKIQNSWDVWVYPAQSEPANNIQGVAIFHELNAAALAMLDSGGTVLWLIPPKNVRNDTNAPVKFGFSPIFWNTSWTQRQAPTTLGVLCNPKHPLFAKFPTEEFGDWPWWYLVHGAQPMLLDELPVKLQPVVQVIDDWSTNRKLGLALEAKVGKGKLFVCSMDLDDTANNPVRRQFRASLLDYLASPRFLPMQSVSTAALLHLESGSPAKTP